MLAISTIVVIVAIVSMVVAATSVVTAMETIVTTIAARTIATLNRNNAQAIKTGRLQQTCSGSYNDNNNNDSNH